MPNFFLCVSQLSLEGFTSWKCSHTWLVIGFFSRWLASSGSDPDQSFNLGRYVWSWRSPCFALTNQKNTWNTQKTHPHHRNSSTKTTAFQRLKNTHLQTNKKLRHIRSLNGTSHANGSIVPPKKAHCWPSIFGYRIVGMTPLIKCQEFHWEVPKKCIRILPVLTFFLSVFKKRIKLRISNM